jgi:hypothetical protein
MLQRVAWLRRLAIELDAGQIKGILHAHNVPLELVPHRRLPASNHRRRNARREDAQKLVLSRLIPAERFCIELPLVEDAAAQLDAASGASGVQHCVPSPFLPLHPNAHHPSLALHLEE